MGLPLLAIGTFGTHLIADPGKPFHFVGTAPEDLKNGSYATEQEGIDAFIAWFRSTSLDFQRQHVANLRNDVFTQLLSA